MSLIVVQKNIELSFCFVFILFSFLSSIPFSTYVLDETWTYIYIYIYVSSSVKEWKSTHVHVLHYRWCSMLTFIKMKQHNKYTSIFKHNVLEEYRLGIHRFGFKCLARRFKIKGGHKLIMNWYRQWDGTVQSLNPRSKGGRPRTMTKNEVKHYVLGFVNRMNNQFKPVNYRMVQSNVESLLNKKVPLSTIQRYGREESGLRWRKIHIVNVLLHVELMFFMTNHLCKQIFYFFNPDEK